MKKSPTFPFQVHRQSKEIIAKDEVRLTFFPPSLKMKAPSRSAVRSLPFAALLALIQLSTRVNADPAPLVIQGGDAPTSTKTLTVTPGVVIPDTTITVFSLRLDGSLDTTFSGAAATSYLLAQSASLSSKECDELALHGVQCTSVTTVTTTADLADVTGEGASIQGTVSANIGVAGAPLPFWGSLQRVGSGELSLIPELQGLGALVLAGVCGLLALVL